MPLGVGDDTRAGSGEYVSADYFSTLGSGPAAGRLLDANDDRVGAEAAAVSFAFARRYFEDPAQAVGARLLVNNTPFTIVGVTPRGFFGTIRRWPRMSICHCAQSRKSMRARTSRRAGGPTASAELRRHGFEPSLEASRPKMGLLVREAAATEKVVG